MEDGGAKRGLKLCDPLSLTGSFCWWSGFCNATLTILLILFVRLKSFDFGGTAIFGWAVYVHHQLKYTADKGPGHVSWRLTLQ